MRRMTVAAVLVVAGVLGTAGGSYAAFVARPPLQVAPDEGPSASARPTGSAHPSRSPSAAGGPSSTASDPSGAPTGPSASPGQQGPSRRSVFYFADDRIHDGGRTVPVTLSRDYRVSSLQRVGDGWLVVQLQSEGGEQEVYYGTFVYPDGRTWELGTLGLAWDIDARDRILFTSDTFSWFAADPATHKLQPLDIVDGPGEDPPYLPDGEPEPWIQWAGSGVLTGWATSTGSQLVITDTNDYNHTEVGPVGIYRPNTSPDGRLAVGSASPEPGGQPFCLSGGMLTDDDWWLNCEFMRLSYSSPYSPGGSRLLTLDTHLEGYGPERFAILDARTGERETWVDAPKWTYDAAWADDQHLTVLSHPSRSEENITIIHRIALDGTRQQIAEVRGPVALGDA